MGKFDGVLLASDFDNTLAVKAEVSPENRDALAYFMSEGGLFSLATGRFSTIIDTIDPVCRPNTYCPVLNGVAIFSPAENRIIEHTQLDRDKASEFTSRLVDICPEIYGVWLHTLSVAERVEPESAAAAARDFGDPLTKIVYNVPTEKSDEYFSAAKELGGNEFLVIRSWINGIELLPRGAGKEDALRRIRELLGSRVKLTVAAGDYENDTGMVREADIGYAVANAVPEVLAAADRITLPAAGHAIAAIISDIEIIIQDKTIQD